MALSSYNKTHVKSWGRAEDVPAVKTELFWLVFLDMVVVVVQVQVLEGQLSVWRASCGTVAIAPVTEQRPASVSASTIVEPAEQL